MENVLTDLYTKAVIQISGVVLGLALGVGTAIINSVVPPLLSRLNNWIKEEVGKMKLEGHHEELTEVQRARRQKEWGWIPRVLRFFWRILKFFIRICPILGLFWLAITWEPGKAVALSTLFAYRFIHLIIRIIKSFDLEKASIEFLAFIGIVATLVLGGLYGHVLPWLWNSINPDTRVEIVRVIGRFEEVGLIYPPLPEIPLLGTINIDVGDLFSRQPLTFPTAGPTVQGQCVATVITTEGDGLRVRTGPSEDYAQVSRLAQGQRVSVDARSSNHPETAWLKLAGQDYWIAGWWVSKDPSCFNSLPIRQDQG